MPTKEIKASGAGEGLDRVEGSLNIEQILDVEVTVVVRFGKVELPLQDVAQLAPGSVVELDRQPEEPVELLVNDKVFATGQVVVADGNYALRIERILSPEDRIRSLGS
jgi:flagellar motor switch protein FliN/FliY